MSTYLELCQKMIRDLGLSISISSVTSQTGMQQKITDWIADADEAIQTKWTDWDFLLAQHSVNTISGVRAYSAPSDLGAYDFDSFYLNYTSDDYQKLNYLEYIKWREVYRQGTQTNSEPDQFIIAPDESIYLEAIPDAVYTLTCDYWKVPTKMTANTSTTSVPARFERAIIARAEIYYAQHEEFANVYETATKEFDDLMDRLEADQLPGTHKARRRARSHDIDTTIRPI